MRTLSFLFCCVVIVVFVAGCASKPMQSATEGQIPEWYTNTPQDPNYLFAATTATSQDLQLAIDKAAASGRAEIGRQVETRIQALQKKFDEEVGLNTDAQLLQMFTSASKTVVSTSLSGSQIKYQKPIKDGDIWRGYVLVQYPIGAANKALMQQIKSHEYMYTRFRASQTFKELDDEVNKYEEWKKQQATQEQQ